MKELDLFKDYAQGEINLLIAGCEERRGGNRRLGKSQEELDRGDRNRSEARRGQVASAKSRERMSEAQKERWANTSINRRLEIGGEISKACQGRIPSKGFLGHHHTEETKERLRENWTSLSIEEKEGRLRSSFLSKEAIRKLSKVLNTRPNELEKWVDRRLQQKFPHEWVYNGDFSEGIMIGGKIPDFMNINGRKEVISVMGGLGRFHFLEDKENEIEHYARFGYRCTVIWEWDAYDPEELDKILELLR